MIIRKININIANVDGKNKVTASADILKGRVNLSANVYIPYELINEMNLEEIEMYVINEVKQSLM